MLDMLFNLYKVKFTKLDELIASSCENIHPYSNVNVFINVENIINRLTSSNVDEYLRVKNEDKIFELISSMINLAAHYRLFFSKNKIHSKVYLYIPYPFKKAGMKNRTINESYRKAYEYRFDKNANNFILSETIISAIPFIKLIFEYLDGVYFVESGNIESSLIPHVITSDKDDNVTNFIVTNNQYEYQYVVKGYYIIIPKQSDSTILTKDNIIETICENNGIDNTGGIQAHHLPFILSVIGNKQRGISNIKGIGVKRIFKMLSEAIAKSIVDENINNITLLLSTIDSRYVEQILENYYCTDLDYQYKALTTKDIYHITSQLRDKYDNDSLKRLNDEHFKTYPINLMEVTSTVSNKRNSIIF